VALPAHTKPAALAVREGPHLQPSEHGGLQAFGILRAARTYGQHVLPACAGLNRRCTAQGYLPNAQEEEAAAFFSMSVGAFRKWQERDATAPKPHWFGQNCKRYKVSELVGASDPSLSAQGPNPWDDAA
jgi:hypothetical protein